MGIIRTGIALTGWGTLGTVVTFSMYTRKSKVHDLPPTDYLLGTTLLARFNPYNNPALKDICVRRVRIDRIRPELLEKEGKLVEAFSAGVWSGWGYAFQRRYLERKYKGPETSSQLWSLRELQESTYEPGTQITDHFEVLNKTENSIILRAGDTPRVNAIRENDGLFEILVDVRRDEGVVEFGLKSIFYNGLERPDKQGDNVGAAAKWVWWLHAKYDKILMEGAVKYCMK